jgi:alpha-ketoglutarate-dependent taurine dioxygenase
MSAVPQKSTPSRLQVRRLGTTLGAEVRGIDMKEPLDAETRNELLDIWTQHLVLVFPGQKVSDTEHVEFTRFLGEPEIFHQKIIKSASVREIFRVSNVDESGTLMPPDNPTVQQLSLAQYWHTDSSYRHVPCKGALLHGIEVSKTGGETEFTNMYDVYAALPPALKAKVDGRRARHNFEHMQTLRPLKPLTEEERAAMPPMWQPMVRVHPVSGRKSLYISPIYNDEVEGMTPQEGQKLVAELAEFAGQKQFVYRHYWTTDDVVMWDNRCTMHQVTAFDPTERRVMHRTTIVGDAPVVAA